MGKGVLFNACYWDNCLAICKDKLNAYLTSFTKYLEIDQKLKCKPKELLTKKQKIFFSSDFNIENNFKAKSSYGQIMFNKGAKNTQWWKESFFNKWCWEKNETISQFVPMYKN